MDRQTLPRAPIEAQSTTAAPTCPNCGTPVSYHSSTAQVYCGLCGLSFTLNCEENSAFCALVIGFGQQAASDLLRRATRIAGIEGSATNESSRA
jgi:primosomal protein N'